MNIVSYILLAAVVALFLFVAYRRFGNRSRKGCNGGCSCSGCSCSCCG